MRDEFSIDDRIGIAKMFLASLRKNFQDRNESDPITRKAKIWSKYDHVRIYGLSDDNGFLVVTRYGDVKRIEGNFLYEVEDALDEFHDYLYSRRRDLEKWEKTASQLETASQQSPIR